MDCPNCRLAQPEGALECAACAIIFAKWRGFSRPVRRVVPYAHAHFERWVFTGTMVAEPGGVTFFIEDSQYHPSVPARIAAWIAGRFGGLLVELLAERALDAAASKPAALGVGPREALLELYNECLSDDPRLASCKEQFRLPLARITGVWAPEDDSLFIMTEGFALEISGGIEAQALSAALRIWGCPGKPAGVLEPSSWRHILGMALLLAAGLALFGDMLEVQEFVNWASRSLGLHALFFDANGTPSPYLVIAAASGLVSLVVGLKVFLFSRERSDDGFPAMPEAPAPGIGPVFVLLAAALALAWAGAAYWPISAVVASPEPAEPGTVLITYRTGKKCLLRSPAFDSVIRRQGYAERRVYSEPILKAADLEVPLADLKELRFISTGAEAVLRSGRTASIMTSDGGGLSLRGSEAEPGCPLELALSAKTFALEEAPLRAEFR